MKLATTIGRYLIYLVGAFFILMAFDCFDSTSPGTDTFWKQLACFGASISPGVILIVLNYLLRKHELIMGIILVLTAIGLFFLFKFYRQPLENLLTIAIVNGIPLVCGILFIVSRQRFDS